jgi:RNA polymerase sigma-70 factor (ECF subfamily)
MNSRAAASAAMTDQQLMRRVQADDDDQAFELLYDRHRDRAWRVAQLLRRPGNHADRLLEEVFITIWRERAAYRPARETVQAWTMRLVYRRAADPDQPDDLLPTSTVTGVPAIGGGRRGASAEPQGLRRLLDRLPAQQREIIALAFEGGLTHVQIAEVLALPPGTVKGRMRLGLHELRRVIDDERTGEDPQR